MFAVFFIFYLKKTTEKKTIPSDRLFGVNNCDLKCQKFAVQNGKCVRILG